MACLFYICVVVFTMGYRWTVVKYNRRSVLSHSSAFSLYLTAFLAAVNPKWQCQNNLCVCVCVRERKRERAREAGKIEGVFLQHEKESQSVWMSVREICLFIYSCTRGKGGVCVQHPHICACAHTAGPTC